MMKNFSRRKFLKYGLLGAGALGLTAAGVGLSRPIPGPEDTELATFNYEGNDMQNKILIAYASAFGSTAQVAAELGSSFNARGLTVDVCPLGEEPALAEYQAIFLGSAVQYGNWLAEAQDYVQAHQAELPGRLAAVFCVYIANQGQDARNVAKRHAYLDKVRPYLPPVEEAYFTGRFDRRGAALLMPRLIANLMPTWDMRDPQKVQNWAGNFSFS